MTRQRAEAQAAEAAAEAEVSPTPSRPARPRHRGPHAPLPRDVKALLAGLVLVIVAGIGWLAFGPSPEPVTPLLGFVDSGPPPAPTPTPPPSPAFKLPWWK
jgi:hypothetical protein